MEDYNIREELSITLENITSRSAKGEISIADFKKEVQEVVDKAQKFIDNNK